MTRWHSLPAEVYALVDETPATVLLECALTPARAPERDGEQEFVSRLFAGPLRVLEATEPHQIPELFAAMESVTAAGGFAAGFFAYECGGCFEPTTNPHPRQPDQPLAWLGLYERPYLFDHRTGRFVAGAPPGLERFAPNPARSVANFDRLAPRGRNQTEAAAPPLNLRFALSEAEYAERIAAIHEWIRAGDIYQLNFTAPLRISTSDSAAALYLSLRGRQPVEFGAFLHSRPGQRILSFSPELFFRVDGQPASRRITARPMKGTARRGRTTREDREQAHWLCNDPKNRSENLMIVDLLRNDLGRLARFGTVCVDELFTVERYPTLWQMTSTITAELRPEVGFQQIFRALFPCGSVTGAPKVRAMQLIAQIEPEPRGVYTGAIGYFSRERTVFSVAIRTLELENGQGRMGLGSGIVIDSDPAAEYRECLLKAEFLTRAAARFSLIETLLWQNGYPLLELHLDRLADAADYFGFPCDPSAVRTALLESAQKFSGQQPRKVRLLLDPDGELQITDETLPLPTAEPRVIRARIAPERTDPTDPFLFHKTTHRPLYARAFEQASAAGFDEVLFLNQRGELTEGAISNAFVVKDGCWLTPPIECGLLGGVFRRHLLETRPDIEERVLTLDDLRTADAVYVANAVRGLRRVEVDWKTSASTPAASPP
jgi:para-aminobenzoate synthetase / 4-amino-4-deoxychorismate lyase